LLDLLEMPYTWLGRPQNVLEDGAANQASAGNNFGQADCEKLLFFFYIFGD